MIFKPGQVLRKDGLVFFLVGDYGKLRPIVLKSKHVDPYDANTAHDVCLSITQGANGKLPWSYEGAVVIAESLEDYFIKQYKLKTMFPYLAVFNKSCDIFKRLVGRLRSSMGCR